MTHDEMIAVIQAHKDGKAVEAKWKRSGGRWGNCCEPVWNFDEFDYRVKPEPREVWINIHPIHEMDDFAYETRAEAERNSASGSKPVLFREVLD